MKLEGLLWSEIQDIKSAIEEKKRCCWERLSKRFIKTATHEQIVKARKEFDEGRNQFREEDRCNRILDIIQELDDEMKKELRR